MSQGMDMGLDPTLALGVERGLITPAQAEGLRALAAEAAAQATGPALPEDDERLRLVTGFGDIFVSVGLVLFLAAFGFFAAMAGLLGLAAGLAIACWGLAEVFTARRRMALPSILLLVGFVAACFGLAVVVFTMLAGLVPGLEAPQPHLERLLDKPVAAGGPVIVALSGLAAVAAAVAHYRRFAVPVTPAAGVAALIVAALGALAALAPDVTAAWFSVLLVLAGLGTFLLAMRQDLADPARLTRRADVAFWLHLLAAPLVVHGLLHGIVWGTLAGEVPPSPARAAGVLAILAGLGLVAVVVDRRPLLASGLVYAGIALVSLLQRTGIHDSVLPLTMLLLGAGVLALSAGWHPIRRALLRGLPAGLANRLPHPVTPTIQAT